MDSPYEQPGSRIVRVERDDPPLFACATCGWAPGYTGTPAPLLWAVIRHWLATHWDPPDLDNNLEREEER